MTKTLSEAEITAALQMLHQREKEKAAGLVVAIEAGDKIWNPVSDARREFNRARRDRRNFAHTYGREITIQM